MKIQHTTKVLLPVLLLVMFASCKKDAPSIFDMFKVTLTFHQSEPYAVDENGDIEITSNDSVLVDYTLESPDEDMYVVCLYKTGGNIPIQKIPITDDGKRRSYSGTFKFHAKDLGAGLSSYRIWPLDKNGVYLGDGYKRVTINVLSDLKYFPNRKIYAADTTGKVNPCYLSIKDGNTYSYSTGAANSGDIDFAFYTKVVPSGTTTKTEFFIYSLTADPLPFTPYDISGWTKRSTLFSAPTNKNANINTFRTRFNTGPKIEEEAKAVNIDLTHHPKALAANNFIFFKTPEGKYGVLFIHSVSNENYNGIRYMVVSYKIQE